MSHTRLSGVEVHRTAKETSERLADAGVIQWQTGAPQSLVVHVDPRPRFQTIEGFGGAFTEAAAVTLSKISPEARRKVLAAYFDPKVGHGYSLCRTHFNSCDFSVDNYAYDETDGDFELKHFSIDRDRQALLPMIKDAAALAGGSLKIFASPWSPPAWMKTTGKMNFGGKLRPECRQVWADYYCRYIKEYARAGVKIWGLTVQNEPEATQTWDSCIYTAIDERDFVRDYLGPTLHRQGLADVKVIIWDHNRDVMYQRAQAVYDDPEAAKYVWGTGFHWYCGDYFDNVRLVHDAWPEKKLLFTEGCAEHGPHRDEWHLGERYARSVINDLNRWTVGWTDWNLVLDEMGGPNHVGNYCSAPIIVDTQTGEVHYLSSYYYLGHFCRFIRPGAQRIVATTGHDALETTAFINPDGSVAVVVMNRTDQDIAFSLAMADRFAPTTSPRHSIQTFVFAGR